MVPLYTAKILLIVFTLILGWLTFQLVLQKLKVRRQLVHNRNPLHGTIRRKSSIVKSVVNVGSPQSIPSSTTWPDTLHPL